MVKCLPVASRSFPEHRQFDGFISGAVLDRFLPETSELDGTLYRSRFRLLQDHSKHEMCAQPISPEGNVHAIARTFHIQNGYFLVSPNLTSEESVESPGTGAVTSEDESDSSLESQKEKSGDGERIAKALGFTKKSRIMSFKPFQLHRKQNKKVSFDVPSSESMLDDFNKVQKKLTKSAVAPRDIPFKVLDASGLRNDYYSNTVCWSKDSDILAVGLGEFLYTWNEKLGTVPLQKLHDEIISSVSFSHAGVLAVGTKSGRVAVYDKDSQTISVTCLLKPSTGISCIKWLSSGNHFYTGDDTGDVTLYEYRKVAATTGYKYSLTIRISIRCSRQQICGIDIDQDCAQVAVGSNDNCCTLFKIEDFLYPKKLFCLSHKAAVKAVAFCPWMPNLLATGGGSKDRCIRFWHTVSGTLVKEFETTGQVTSLIWSRSKKELLATFGFGSPGEKASLLKVYSYPSMKVVLKVDSSSDMRVLTADLSNDQRCICAGLSDQSIRIYSIWDSKYDLKTGKYDNGLFESELIDLEEGVDTSFEIIR